MCLLLPQAGQVSDEVREAAAEETLEGSSAGYSSVEGTQDGSTEEAYAGEDDPDASAADTLNRTRPKTKRQRIPVWRVLPAARLLQQRKER